PHHLNVTTDHPIYIEGQGWLNAENLSIGDRLRRSDGGMARVLAIERIVLDEARLVYNFTVKGPHTYFVLEVGVLVHNVDCITWQAYQKKHPGAVLFPVDDTRFTQVNYSFFGEGYTVGGNVDTLNLPAHKGLYLDVDPVLIFEKTKKMEAWGPMTHPNLPYFGHAENLVNGKIYSVDNRRLVAYKMAGRYDHPVQWMSAAEIAKIPGNPLKGEVGHGFKFSTPNKGLRIFLHERHKHSVPTKYWTVP
ncbi:MAG: hypothetical protein GY797_23040, partial [Deltaproteobacteria bacterium]|nr:hypothetical protein [Deltaproteobacteria bacterium]